MRTVLRVIVGSELPQTLAALRCAEKTAIVPTPMEESIASKLLRIECPVVATMKDVGLLCDTSFATLLIRATELIRSQHSGRKFDLQQIIMDERSAEEQKDTAMGELLVTQGGYLTLNAATKFTSAGSPNTVFPVLRRKMTAVFAEEPDASAKLKLRAECPVVATMKEAGLCDTSFATLLVRTKHLIQSQQHNRAFNLHRRIIDERSTRAMKDTALGELLVTHGGYFSLADFKGSPRAWCQWKGQFLPGAPSPLLAPMQLQVGWRTGPGRRSHNRARSISPSVRELLRAL
jgi:hypothetical protein